MPAGDLETTQLLDQWRDGHADALDKLLPGVYSELRAIASNQLRSIGGQFTLQPTALVSEFIVRLLESDVRALSDRRHLFNLAGRMMRQILITRARRSGAIKRGGDWQRDELHEALSLPVPDNYDVLELDSALTALESINPELAKIVELRCFVGLAAAEVGAVLDIDERTVHRRWALSLAWLQDRAAG